MKAENKKAGRTHAEQIEISGAELVDRMKQLIREGNCRRVIIRKPNNEILLDLPLTAGVAVGGTVAILAPVLAALGGVAALFKRVKIDIVRTTDDGEG